MQLSLSRPYIGLIFRRAQKPCRRYLSPISLSSRKKKKERERNKIVRPFIVPIIIIIIIIATIIINETWKLS